MVGSTNSLMPAMARGVVQRAINQLKGMGVVGPTRDSLEQVMPTPEIEEFAELLMHEVR